MTTKLDALGNVIPADQRPRIEAALAKKVPKVSAAEITAFDLVYQEKFRAEYGECRNCYLSWPQGRSNSSGRPTSMRFTCVAFNIANRKTSGRSAISRSIVEAVSPTPPAPMPPWAVGVFCPRAWGF
jgi:hypothetical protein